MDAKKTTKKCKIKIPYISTMKNNNINGCEYLVDGKLILLIPSPDQKTVGVLDRVFALPRGDFETCCAEGKKASPLRLRRNHLAKKHSRDKELALLKIHMTSQYRRHPIFTTLQELLIGHLLYCEVVNFKPLPPLLKWCWGGVFYRITAFRLCQKHTHLYRERST